MRTRDAPRVDRVGLFREGQPARPGTVVATVLAVAAGALLLLLRQTGAGALDTIYAEDGAVFLRDAVAGPTAAVLRPYAGYLHVIPRLTAIGVAALPPTVAAAAQGLVAAVAVSALGQVTRVAMTPHVRSARLPWAMAAAFVLLPVGQEEVFNASANIHWFLAVPVFWVLLWRPPSTAGTVGATGFVGLAALSHPFLVLLVPVALVRLRTLPSRRDRAIAWGLLAGAATQVIAMLTADSERLLDGSMDLIRLAGLHVTHVLGGAVLGDVLRTRAPDAVTAVVGVALAAVLVALWVRHHDRFEGHDDALLALLAIGSVGFFAAPVLLAGQAPPRYAVTPVLMLYGLALVVADRTRRAVAGDLLTAVIVLVVTVTAVNYPLVNARSDGPSWDRSVADARSACADAGPELEVAMRMAPDGTFPLPCTWLAGDDPPTTGHGRWPAPGGRATMSAGSRQGVTGWPVFSQTLPDHSLPLPEL